jgi:hypothetical protein
MYKNAMKCNETLSKWCKNKHGASKIIDMFETYQGAGWIRRPHMRCIEKQRREAAEGRPSRSDAGWPNIEGRSVEGQKS